MSEKVAQRYAQAIFESGRESQKLAVVHRDLKLIGQTLEQSRDLAEFLDNPVIPSEKRQSVLKDIFHGKIDALTYKFLLFLESKLRLNQLGTICVVFDRLYADARGVMKTRWTTSTDISEADTHAITQYLKTKFQKDIESRHEVDENLLGGIKIQIGDAVYDYSLQAQLKKFKQAIMNA